MRTTIALLERLVGSRTNVDPASRMALEVLVPIARMHVGDLTGADLSTTDVVTCSRSQWAADTPIPRPLFTDLATALSGATGVERMKPTPWPR